MRPLPEESESDASLARTEDADEAVEAMVLTFSPKRSPKRSSPSGLMVDSSPPGLITASSTIDPDASDYDDKASPTNSSPTNASLTKKYEWHLELTSVFLFVLGSVLYLCCAVYDYQWTTTLLELPDWIRGVDDDEVWMRYRLEEEFGDVESMSEPIRGRRLARGGFRRRLTEQQYLKQRKKQLYEKVVEAKQSQRKLQDTPEELYYDLDWDCLPAEIQAAYTILGHDQNTWDNSITVDTDTLDWSMLSDMQREAALVIGYNEMIWCEFDDAVGMLELETDEPTASPIHKPTTPPTNAPISNPTNRPTPRPTRKPTNAPTVSVSPTASPTNSPTVTASESPSLQPSSSSKPTMANVITLPDGSIVQRPTTAPSYTPTNTPSFSPTERPTAVSSEVPSVYPSMEPSAGPTGVPTISPTKAPSYQPSQSPTEPIIIFKPDPTEVETVQIEFITPDDKYEDEWWRDLPPEVQEAFAVLGWTETAWDEGLSPPSETMMWDELTPEMQEAAASLGYNELVWDADFVGTGDALNDDAQVSSSNATSSVVDNDYVVEDPAEYEEYDWAELPPEVKASFATLGWDESLWDSGGSAWSDDLFWEDLPPEAQEAAASIGYTQISWDAGGDKELEALLVAAGGKYVSNDDDYIFEVGSSNIEVSEYQILYFFAALCFFFLGIVDYVREKAPFHILMTLAGLFGVISAIFIEENLRLSNIMDLISVHLYLCEGIAMFSHDRQEQLAYEEEGTRRAIVIADSQFLLGALIDVMLSYFYLLDDTADWDMTLAVTWLFSAVLWLNCALIYLGVFLYDVREEAMETGKL